MQFTIELFANAGAHDINSLCNSCNLYFRRCINDQMFDWDRTKKKQMKRQLGDIDIHVNGISTNLYLDLKFDSILYSVKLVQKMMNR